RLLGERRHQLGVVIAEGVDRDARPEIQISPPILGEKERSFAADECDIRPVIGGEQCGEHLVVLSWPGVRAVLIPLNWRFFYPQAMKAPLRIASAATGTSPSSALCAPGGGGPRTASLGAGAAGSGLLFPQGEAFGSDFHQ